MSQRLTLGTSICFGQLRFLKEHVFLSCPSRGLRYWYKRPGLPFPPNYYRGHQVFYPSLQSILKEREAYENATNLINVGVDTIPVTETVSRREARRKREASTNLTNEKNKSTIDDSLSNLKEEDLLKYLDIEERKLSFSHDVLNHSFVRSKVGIESIVDLAHHYAIYEHLFSNHIFRKPDPTLQHKLTDFWPQMERKWTEEELVKYSPGSRQIAAPDAKDIKFFYPVVPMTIEFAIDEGEKSEDLTVSPVYRGNHIKTKYSKAKPDIIIDASLLNGKSTSFTTFEKLVPDGITLIGDDKNLYTLAMVNLDTQFGESNPVCHWMVSNICATSDGKTTCDEVISFIPPYAFKGFGYHRYVFLLLQQKEKRNDPKIDDVDLNKRIIDLNKLLEEGAKPVGLSWFQSSWDEAARDIFYNILNMREPTYEYIQPEEKLTDQTLFPNKAPFNVYLDAFRDPKEMSKEVLLERLKEVDPFNYKPQVHPSKIPPNIHPRSPDGCKAIPSWYWRTIWKRRNKLGRWRLLRSASAIKPLNNNEDLDYPIWPHSSKLRFPSRHPWGPIYKIPYKDSKWALSLKEHPSLRIEDEDIKGLRREELKEDLEALAKVEKS